MPTDPRHWLGLALVIGVAGFAVGGVIAAFKGTSPDAAMIASICTLLGALAGGLIGHEIGRRE